MPIPAICRIVKYKLRGTDADAINRRRKHAEDHMDEHRVVANGVQVHVGNEVKAGDELPMIMTKVWSDTPGEDTAVNGKVLLDGTDDFWVTSVTVGDGPGQYQWPGGAK